MNLSESGVDGVMGVAVCIRIGDWAIQVKYNQLLNIWLVREEV